MTLPQGYRIVRRTPEYDASLLAIENRAAELFRAHGYPQVADSPFPDVAAIRNLFAGRDVRVAADASGPAGFIVSAPLGPYLHIHELSVDPAHGRRGIGAALVEHVSQAASEGRFDGVSLTTFRDVPFNEPFYVKLGFAEAHHPLLLERLAIETPDGVDPASRIAMIRLHSAFVANM